MVMALARYGCSGGKALALGLGAVNRCSRLQK